jgi:transcriptional regulator with XRE-family HTH domain
VSLAKLIKDKRAELGWSQTELAEYLGISRGYLAQLETEGRDDQPSREILQGLARLGIPLIDLMVAVKLVTPEQAKQLQGAAIINLPEAKDYFARRYPGAARRDYEDLQKMIEVFLESRRGR